jgi:LacI family transcriptional regulator
VSTIKDVARLAGVGVGTASRALSGRGSVSDDAAERVRAAAGQLAYRPSSIAQALSLRRSGAIGVYVPLFDGAFYSEMLGSIDKVLRAHGRHMIAATGCGTGSQRQKALDGIEFLIGRNCDGLLVASNSLSDDDCLQLFRRFPRTVMLNRAVPGHAQACFSVDHEAAGRLAARALLAEGHREIAVIEGPADAPDNRARMRGFFAELAAFGIDVPSTHRCEGGFRFSLGAAAARSLVAAGPAGRPAFTALFAANDLMAMAAISALGELGLRVPQDVSVIGYDDSRFAGYTSPPLTTVHVPIDAVSASGCRLLLNACYESDLPVERSFPPTIAWRGSVMRGPHPPLCERPGP